LKRQNRSSSLLSIIFSFLFCQQVAKNGLTILHRKKRIGPWDFILRVHPATVRAVMISRVRANFTAAGFYRGAEIKFSGRHDRIPQIMARYQLSSYNNCLTATTGSNASNYFIGSDSQSGSFAAWLLLCAAVAFNISAVFSTH
jgi:hypothetical protein